MSSPDAAIKKEKNEKKCRKKKIDAGNLVKEKFGEMEEKKSEGRSRRARKELVVCVQDVIGKKMYLVKFKYRHKTEMSSHSLSYVCSKEEVGHETDDSISNLHQKLKGELLTIDGDTVGEEGSMFEKGIYFLYIIVWDLLTRDQHIC